MEELNYVNGIYRTAPRRPSILARALISPLFYARLISIVIKGSAEAKRGRYATPEWCRDSLFTLRALEAAGVTMEITGINDFTAVDGPCVFIANHMSTLETFVLPVIISSFKDSTFIVKQSLIDYPIFKHIMRTRDPITVGRTNPREDLKAVMEGGAGRLKAGRSVVVFPQTTRTDVFDPASFNTIGVKLAKKAGVPVIPVALKTDAWGNGRLFKDFGKIDPAKQVYFAFGKPLWIKDRGGEEHAEIVEFISAKLKEWGGKTALPD